MKIHIMGASCAGSTTLGNTLAKHLRIPYFDTDDYFWVLTDIPYTIKREPAERIHALKDDIAKQFDCLVGGSLVSWGEEWKEMFDLVVFLYVPQEIRLQRLKDRELKRYGDLIYNDPERNELYNNFIAWATKYEDRNFTGRNIQIHEDWFAGVNCPVLEIRDDTTVAERLKLVLDAINNLR
jgi:adenylate kinase family enzyme